MFYARARINALKLEEHKGRGIEGYNKICKLCEEEVEDLVHFVSKCKKLETVRDYNLLDRNTSDPEERMRKLLYRDERSWKVGKLIKDLWDLRRELLKKADRITGVAQSRKPKKNTKYGNTDSGSGIDEVQGNRGSGPLMITTQGCNGTRPDNIYHDNG